MTDHLSSQVYPIIHTSKLTPLFNRFSYISQSPYLIFIQLFLEDNHLIISNLLARSFFTCIAIEIFLNELSQSQHSNASGHLPSVLLKRDTCSKLTSFSTGLDIENGEIVVSLIQKSALTVFPHLYHTVKHNIRPPIFLYVHTRNIVYQ